MWIFNFHFIFYVGHQAADWTSECFVTQKRFSPRDWHMRALNFFSLYHNPLSLSPLPSLSYEPHQLYFPFISESYSTTGHFVARRIAPNLKRSVVMIAVQGLFTAQTVSAGYAYRITCHWQKGFVRNTGKYSCFTSLKFRVFFTKSIWNFGTVFHPLAFYNVLLYLFLPQLRRYPCDSATHFCMGS
jgi:hypothetical protein